MSLPRLFKGFIITIRAFGIVVAIKEVLRRILGVRYAVNGIQIKTNSEFRLLRSLLLKGYEIQTSNDNVVVKTPFGTVGVNVRDLNILGVLGEPLDDMYGFANVQNGIVVDIGGYIGETALQFLSKGARKVYVVEPVEQHFKYVVENLKRNSYEDRVVLLNHGVWFRDGFLNIQYEGSGTGLHHGNSVLIKVKSLSSLLREVYAKELRIDLVKMDCEGCEYSLLATRCEEIRLANEYIIEIHGATTPIIDKMASCGFEYSKVLEISDLVAVYRFIKRSPQGYLNH